MPSILSPENTLNLTSGGTTPFVIGGTTAPANGTIGSLSSGVVTVTDVKGITVSNTFQIQGTDGGASVNLDTSSLLNSGTIAGGGNSTLKFYDPGKNNLGVNSARRHRLLWICAGHFPDRR